MGYLNHYYINKNNLLKNIKIIKEKLNPETKLCAVVKANAYGVGVREVVSIIKDEVDYYAVANIEEALELRKLDKDKEILILGYVSFEDIELAVIHNLSITIISKEYFLGLTEHLKKSNLNKSKVEAFKERILEINDECIVDCKKVLYSKDSEEFVFDKHYDFVIDAIDTLSLKWELIKTCLNKKIKFISSMGMGNKLDLTKIEITSLDKTMNDPVSKKLREFARKDGINSKLINVVFSKELPYKQNIIVNKEGVTIKERIPPSSIIFTPAVAGLLIGQYILEKTINE